MESCIENWYVENVIQRIVYASLLENERLLQTLLNLSLNPCKYISQQ